MVEACDKGDTSFRVAYEYTKSTDLEDGTATKAVKLVWSQFLINSSHLFEVFENHA